MKIAIVGTEEHTRHLAPFDDPKYKIWVFNEAANQEWCKRWDVLFQLHKPKVYQNLNNRKDPQHWEFLQRKHGKPVVMIEKDPLVPDSVVYPLGNIEKSITDYLTYEDSPQKNIAMTLAYAMALAIWARVESIDVWGIELAYSAEYRSQQNNFAYWVGVANGRNIPVNLHCCKGMFNKPYYGREERMDEERLQNYLVGLEKQIKEKEAELNQLYGARQLTVQMLTEEKEGLDVQKQA